MACKKREVDVVNQGAVRIAQSSQFAAQEFFDIRGRPPYTHPADARLRQLRMYECREQVRQRRQAAREKTVYEVARTGCGGVRCLSHLRRGRDWTNDFSAGCRLQRILNTMLLRRNIALLTFFLCMLRRYGKTPFSMYIIAHSSRISDCAWSRPKICDFSSTI